MLDSTVCGVNPQSKIPEKSFLPTAKDVIRAYPLRNSNGQLSGVSFDVKSAHKQMAVHPKYRGLLCFQFRGRIYYYKVCPFGAVVSAHFWSRLGGAFQRLFHRICYLPHASFLYVDDLLMFQETQIIGLSAAVIAILCMLTRLPVSWKKCEIGYTIVWIGWEFHIRAGFIVQTQQTLGSHSEIALFITLLQKVPGTVWSGPLGYSTLASNAYMAALFVQTFAFHAS